MEKEPKACIFLRCCGRIFVKQLSFGTGFMRGEPMIVHYIIEGDE